VSLRALLLAAGVPISAAFPDDAAISAHGLLLRLDGRDLPVSDFSAELERVDIDVTSFNDDVVRTIPGLARSGSFSVLCDLSDVPDVHALLEQVAYAEFVVEGEPMAAGTFLITALSVEQPVEGVGRCRLTLRPAGPIVVATPGRQSRAEKSGTKRQRRRKKAVQQRRRGIRLPGHGRLID
jgi:hypothetical protein